MNTHITKQFDVDLDNIRTRVLQMGGQVEQQIVDAMAALDKGDLALADQVIDQDHLVNRHEVELDEACTHIIARRQPTASDLRTVMMVIKTITDLERIGDEAKKIAKKARALHAADTPFKARVPLQHAASLALDMLRKALDAFARQDVSAAALIARQDKEVDAEFKSIMRQLITFMMEDPRTISSSLDVLFIAKSIERIGDHAKNVSEYVVYMAKGRDVRHIGIEGIEQEVGQ
ncbi:MAG TPA: phosphate signaling complex protein PhoU [Rhodocyclaceae bacterium]|nr:phosphate signaling complex protein PhoU [Rhodocyclaceae bacterium]